MAQVRQKWRPSLGLVIALVCVVLMSLPLLALLAARLTSNQFVRETEQSLIQQGAIYAELFANSYQGAPVGTVLSDRLKQHWAENIHPARPRLNIRKEAVLPERPEGETVEGPIDPAYRAIAPDLLKLARGAKQTTLSGVVFLDHAGRALTAAGDGVRSFDVLPEVAQALRGEIGSAMRARGDNYAPHPLASLSRDTGYRVFVTFPVILQDRVIGVVYLSRTPLNLGKFLFQERYALIVVSVALLLGAALVGFLLYRLISKPIQGLRQESRAIAAGDRYVPEPLSHYGVRELADLGQSVMSMAQSLDARSSEISTFTTHVTHELKSPVTAILGASELLQDAKGTLDAAQSEKLLSNIQQESQRMTRLLARLREMAQVRSVGKIEAGQLREMLPRLEGLETSCLPSADIALPLSEAHGKIVLLHMAQNAREHGATQLSLRYDAKLASLRIQDNGHGISEKDSTQIFDPFFTTRRESGGTGMGLSIVRALLERYEAQLIALPNDAGAVFEIRFQKS